ncbi:MAG: glutamate synthase, partial [Lysobacterales bacterium]
MVEEGKLKGMMFDLMEYDIENGRILEQRTVGEKFIPCDDVVVAIGQESAFPWIEPELGIEFNEWEEPCVDEVTFESTRRGVFFGGDSAFGPKNIIWAVEHGHQAAI